MGSLPKLSIEGILNADVDNSLVSPVTPATIDNQTGSGGKESGTGNRPFGGLPVSALVNEKDDEAPAPYPWENQPPVGAEPITPARPKFPSILYQMSEFVTEFEERSVKGTLPSLKSLGLPTCKQLEALDGVSGGSTEDAHAKSLASAPKSDENEATQTDEILAVEKRKNTVSEECAKEPEAPRRKRKRAELEAPIMTQSGIENLIITLREKERSRNGKTSKDGASDSSEIQAQEDTENQSQSPASRSTEESSGREIPEISTGRVSKSKKHRRGRPNGDSRPRPHACPTCHRRFLQQSGVVSHYRVVHLKEKRFECTHKCGLRFGARGDVTRHVDAVHNKLRNFECQVCGDAFARKSILTRHCKNMHNDVFGEDEAHDCVHGCVYKAKNKGITKDDDHRETKRRKTETSPERN